MKKDKSILFCLKQAGLFPTGIVSIKTSGHLIPAGKGFFGREMATLVKISLILLVSKKLYCRALKLHRGMDGDGGANGVKPCDRGVPKSAELRDGGEGAR